MKTKLEYKQLDGSIHSKDLEGDKVSLSLKCGDMDKMIPEMLGVSAALLDNVIFCHQESLITSKRSNQVRAANYS